jgi:hypothetical protein
VQEQLHLLPHEGTFAEFNERIIQFGYLVLFASALFFFFTRPAGLQ